jgi:hypothetical protein
MSKETPFSSNEGCTCTMKGTGIRLSYLKEDIKLLPNYWDFLTRNMEKIRTNILNFNNDARRIRILSFHATVRF